MHEAEGNDEKRVAKVRSWEGRTTTRREAAAESIAFLFLLGSLPSPTTALTAPLSYLRFFTPPYLLPPHPTLLTRRLRTSPSLRGTVWRPTSLFFSVFISLSLPRPSVDVPDAPASLGLPPTLPTCVCSYSGVMCVYVYVHVYVRVFLLWYLRCSSVYGPPRFYLQGVPFLFSTFTRLDSGNAGALALTHTHTHTNTHAHAHADTYIQRIAKDRCSGVSQLLGISYCSPSACFFTFAFQHFVTLFFPVLIFSFFLFLPPLHHHFYTVVHCFFAL